MLRSAGDFNQGADGAYSYLCAGTSNSSGARPVTALRAVRTPGNATGVCPTGYEQLDADIHAGSLNTGFTFLCVSRQNGVPIDALTGETKKSGCPEGLAAINGSIPTEPFVFDVAGVEVLLCVGHALGPSPSPGPPPAPTPGIPASCQKALNFVCGKVKAQGKADCLLCAGEHSAVLKAEHCTEGNFEAFCNASATPSGTGSGKSVYVQGRNARSILATAGWSLADSPEDADLIWLINRCYLGTYEPALPQQALNMLPWDLPLVDKGQLARNLQRHDREIPAGGQLPAALGLSEMFLPTTYRLADEEEWAAFCNETASRRARGNSRPWILKRTDLSNGEGARILPDPVRWAESGERERLIQGGGAANYIVQRYIDRPLLLDGRKSELRVYWLVASLEPLVVLYHPGTVRLNTQAYRRADYGNDLIHITNTRRQLQSPELNASQRADHGANLRLKWTHSQLREDLVARGYGSESLERLQHTIRQVLIRATNATLHELTDRVGETRGAFQLLGADFIVDEQLRPWLTELQVGPGLSHDEPVKAGIIPSIVSDAAEIGLAASKAAQLEGRQRGVAMARLGEGSVFQTLINRA